MHHAVGLWDVILGDIFEDKAFFSFIMTNVAILLTWKIEKLGAIETLLT